MQIQRKFWTLPHYNTSSSQAKSCSDKLSVYPSGRMWMKPFLNSHLWKHNCAYKNASNNKILYLKIKIKKLSWMPTMDSFCTFRTRPLLGPKRRMPRRQKTATLLYDRWQWTCFQSRFNTLEGSGITRLMGPLLGCQWKGEKNWGGVFPSPTD